MNHPIWLYVFYRFVGLDFAVIYDTSAISKTTSGVYTLHPSTVDRRLVQYCSCIRRIDTENTLRPWGSCSVFASWRKWARIEFKHNGRDVHFPKHHPSGQFFFSNLVRNLYEFVCLFPDIVRHQEAWKKFKGNVSTAPLVLKSIFSYGSGAVRIPGMDTYKCIQITY